MLKWILIQIVEMITTFFIVLVMHTLVVLGFFAIVYVLFSDSEFHKLLEFAKQWEHIKMLYLAPIVNGSLILIINNIIFRYIIGVYTIYIAAAFYGAIVKYFTGSVALLYDTTQLYHDDAYGPTYIMILFVFFSTYILTIYAIGLAVFGMLGTGEIYRTNEEE